MGFRAKKGSNKVCKVPKKLNVSENNDSEQCEVDNITASSSEDPLADQPVKKVKRTYKKKSDKIPENNHATSSRFSRKCRYTGTYNPNNCYQIPQIKKTVKLKDRLAEIERLISQNKATGITLDYDENEAKSFFDALGIRRIYPSHI